MTQRPHLDALAPLAQLACSSASELKNAFKGVYQQTLSKGAVCITRNRKPEAVLITGELYERILEELAIRDPLESLRRDYEARFAAGQTDEAHAGYEAAFSASPAQLGEAAVTQARPEAQSAPTVK